MSLSLKIGKQHNEKYRHISFLCHKNNIICYGINSNKKTHPLFYRYNKDRQYLFVHSEVNCITRWPYRIRDIKDCTLFNVRLGKQGRLLMSRPCCSCARVLAAFGIERVWFTNQNGEFEKAYDKAGAVRRTCCI